MAKRTREHIAFDQAKAKALKAYKRRIKRAEDEFRKDMQRAIARYTLARRRAAGES